MRYTVVHVYCVVGIRGVAWSAAKDFHDGAVVPFEGVQVSPVAQFIALSDFAHSPSFWVAKSGHSKLVSSSNRCAVQASAPRIFIIISNRDASRRGK